MQTIHRNTILNELRAIAVDDSMPPSSEELVVAFIDSENFRSAIDQLNQEMMDIEGLSYCDDSIGIDTLVRYGQQATMRQLAYLLLR